jgi:hypothetical protein
MKEFFGGRLRVLPLAAIVLLVFFATVVNVRWLVGLLTNPTTGFAWDFAINWTAARGQLDGVSLYDWQNLQAIGITHIGPRMADLFQDPFTSYIGLPTTALFVLPFAHLSFAWATLLYRLTCVIFFITAVGVLVQTLPAHLRSRGWGLGLAALTTINAFATSVWLGQVDAFIVLALAVCLWGIHKGAWGIAGIGLGIATLLKISPGVLIIYLVLRRQWRAAGSAIVTMGVLMAVALWVGRPDDLARFIIEVSPSLSQGSIYWQNHALPALLARLFVPSPLLISYATGLGMWRVVALFIVACGMLVLWWKQHQQPLEATEAATLILIGLLAGPITWNHYLSWALILLVSAKYLWSKDDHSRWPRLYAGLLVAGWSLLVAPIPYASNNGSLLYWVRTCLPTLSLIALTMSQALLLSRSPKRSVAKVGNSYDATTSTLEYTTHASP